MGRFSVEVELVNHVDASDSRRGLIPPEKVRRAVVSGIVDTGAARLILPQALVDQLGFPPGPETSIRLADGRREQRQTVTDVELHFAGRTDTFLAVVAPGRSDASIGAMVLEGLAAC